MHLMTIRLQIICWYFYHSRYHVLVRDMAGGRPGKMEDRFPERYSERRFDDTRTRYLSQSMAGGLPGELEHRFPERSSERRFNDVRTRTDTFDGNDMQGQR